MTTQKLQQKPIGVIETRNLIIKHNGHEYEEHYSLVKGKNGKYFIGFSDDGSYCSSTVNVEDMVQFLNDEKLSAAETLDIYMKSPQLSCWMDN